MSMSGRWAEFLSKNEGTERIRSVIEEALCPRPEQSVAALQL